MTTKPELTGAAWVARRIKQADYTVAELTSTVAAQNREIVAQRQQIARLRSLVLRSGVKLPRDLAAPASGPTSPRNGASA